MAAYINLYMNNPTEGSTDGTLVSTDGAQTSPVSVTLKADESESKTITLAVRCLEGYKTASDVVISATGTTASYWTFSKDNTDFTSTITITDVIYHTNVLFYAKASSASTEEPANDTSVSIKLETTITADV